LSSSEKTHISLSYESAEACAESLRLVCERLKPLIDLSPIFPNLTAEGVMACAIAGAPPSKCAGRVRSMLSGGFAGLRAFCHLASEAAYLKAAGFDPSSEQTPVEPTVNVKGKPLGEAMLARHQALFTFGGADGTGVSLWAQAHTEALVAELAVVEHLIKTRTTAVPDRGVLFWADPGLSRQEIDINAEIAMKLGVTLAPQSTAPVELYRDAYGQIVAIANGETVS